MTLPLTSPARAGAAHKHTTTALHRSMRPMLAFIKNVMLVSGLLHPHGVLIYHQVGIRRPIKHDIHP